MSRYYVESSVDGSGNRVAGDIDAATPRAAAQAMAARHSDKAGFVVWKDFNASTEKARRVSPAAKPLLRWRRPR